MAAPIRLAAPRYRVTIGNPEDESTWAQLDAVQVLSLDLMRAEQIMHKSREKPADLPIRFGAIAAWAALKRRGDITATWEEFAGQLIDLDSDGETVSTPTEPAPEAGSS